MSRPPERITVVFCGQGEAPAVREVDASVESFQALVGGYFQAVPLGERLVLYCNEEGAMIPLPPNRCGIRGPFFVSKVDHRGEAMSLAPHEVEAVLAHLEVTRDLPCTPEGGSWEVRTAPTLDQLWRDEALRREDDLRRN